VNREQIGERAQVAPVGVLEEHQPFGHFPESRILKAPEKPSATARLRIASAAALSWQSLVRTF